VIHSENLRIEVLDPAAWWYKATASFASHGELAERVSTADAGDGIAKSLLLRDRK